VNVLDATRKVEASVTERLAFDFKQEKAADLEALRVKLEAQHKEQARSLKDQIRKLNETVSGHEDKVRADSSESQRRDVNKKLSLQSLRKIVSNLLKDMKLALKPPVNAPLDTSEASPSVAMGKLQTLAKALSLKTPDFTALHAASAEAHVAPPVAFDILQECVIELVDDLNQANKEIIALHMESMRDTKMLRKQVEDDVTGKYMRQLLEQRHKVTQQVEAATMKLERELDAKHKRELREQQESLEREIRATRQDVLARTFKDQHKADVLANTTAADMEEERLREIRALGKELDHVRAELDDCLQELEDRKIENNEMRRENHELRDELQHANSPVRQSRSDATLSPGGVSPKRSGISLESGATGSSSDVDLERLYQVRMEERANAEMERLRLEKQINNLQRINDDLEDQLDELQQGPGAY